MAGVVHITEAEAARDFAAVMRHVRAGEEVVLRDCEGSAVGVVRPMVDGERFQDNSAEAVIARLQQWEAENGPLVLDADFVRDMDEIHREYNQPLPDRWG